MVTAEIQPSSAPYRPAWESSEGYAVVADASWFVAIGTPPQWSDHSDATYAYMKHDMAPVPSSPGLTVDTYPVVVADLPASPQVLSIDTVTVRMNYVSAQSGSFPSVRWRLRNKATGTTYASVDPADGTVSIDDYTYTAAGSSAALPDLQTGNLCVEVSPSYGLGEIHVYEVWLGVTTNGAEPPPVDTGTGTYRRPSLRQLHRGGRGGIGGIPRAVGDRTVYGSPRRGPGLVR